MTIGGGRADRETAESVFTSEAKRGVPRLHDYMLPGNSFPQICVVSKSIMWVTGKMHKST
jgi:hypothetical protein